VEWNSTEAKKTVFIVQAHKQDDEGAKAASAYRRSALKWWSFRVAFFVAPPTATYLATLSAWGAAAAAVTAALAFYNVKDFRWVRGQSDAVWDAWRDKKEHEARNFIEARLAEPNPAEGIIQELRSARMIRRMGGEMVYRHELQERKERQAAIAVQHETIKAAFRISGADGKDAPDDPSNGPLDLIATVTALSPPEAYRRYVHSTSFHSGGDGGSGGGSATYTEAKKFYQFIPRVNGSRVLDSNNVVSGKNHSPFVGFSYYERRLVNDGGSGGQDRPAIYHRFLGGIATPNPQFAVIIHDGYELRKTPQSTFAGLDTGKRVEQWKGPIRICVLGEVDESGDTMHIRRMFMDGRQMKLTRENVALGIDYAANLVAQIVEGANYDPAAAMQKALASQPRLPGVAQAVARPN